MVLSMPPRRINPLSPMLATASEQKALLAMLDHRPEIATAIASVTGRPFTDLSAQEKLILLRNFSKAGLAAAPIRQSARILRELVNEGQHVDEAAEVTSSLVEEVATLSKALRKARKKIAKLEAELAKAKGETA